MFKEVAPDFLRKIRIAIAHGRLHGEARVREELHNRHLGKESLDGSIELGKVMPVEAPRRNLISSALFEAFFFKKPCPGVSGCECFLEWWA